MHYGEAMTLTVLSLFQGSVELRDGDSEYLSIELTKTAGTQTEVDLITQQVEIQDTPRGKVLLIQVVSLMFKSTIEGSKRVHYKKYYYFIRKIIIKQTSYSRKKQSF